MPRLLPAKIPQFAALPLRGRGLRPNVYDLAIFILIAVYRLYLNQALQIRWRGWMTRQVLDRWLADRAYYRIALTDPGTDNPDQRIAEDIRQFVSD